jgi:hypothetical protein
MKQMALTVGIVGAMFLTSIYAIAQTESANQKLGVPGAAPESDKNIGPPTSDSSANQKLGAQKLGTPGAAPESDKNIGPEASDSSADQKLGAQKLGGPGATPESDKNIGPGASDSTIGSDKKHSKRRSAPSK